MKLIWNVTFGNLRQIRLNSKTYHVTNIIKCSNISPSMVFVQAVRKSYWVARISGSTSEDIKGGLMVHFPRFVVVMLSQKQFTWINYGSKLCVGSFSMVSFTGNVNVTSNFSVTPLRIRWSLEEVLIFNGTCHTRNLCNIHCRLTEQRRNLWSFSHKMSKPPKMLLIDRTVL